MWPMRPPEWRWGSSQSAKQLLLLGAGAPWGWGQQGTQSWGLRLSPHRLPGPPSLCTVQTCLELLPVAFALVSELQLCKSQPFLCPTTMASAPQTLGQHILLWGAVSPLFIHLLLLGRLPQAAGRAQQETSTLRFCKRHVGPCWSPLQPRARAGGSRSWRKMVPTPGCSPALRTGAFWSSAPSPRVALSRLTLYLGPAAAGPSLLFPRLSHCLAGGHGGHQSQLCVSVFHPASRAAVRGCSACWALYIL